MPLRYTGLRAHALGEDLREPENNTAPTSHQEAGAVRYFAYVSCT